MLDTLTDAFGTLGSKFTEPRPIQTDILTQLWTEQPRIALVEAPVGIGKSGVAVTYGQILKDNEDLLHAQVGTVGPSVYLTATISLQEQYERDFDGMALAKGRGNFPCLENELTAAEGACTADKEAYCGGPYYSMRTRCMMSDRVVANYAVYLYETFFGAGFLGMGKHRPPIRPRLLVLDEAHRLLDLLTEFEKVSLDAKLAEKAGYENPGGWGSLQEAQTWAREHMETIDYNYRQAVTGGLKVARTWKALKQQTESMAVCPPDFLELQVGERVEASPLWPRRSAERLFRSGHRILAMSGTLYGGHLLAELLGLKSRLNENGLEYSYYTVPSPFDPRRWPVHFRPLVDLNARSSDEEWKYVANECHGYMHKMANTRGVIHVTAAKQVPWFVEEIAGCPECWPRFHFPIEGRKRAEVIDGFRKGGPGAWLIHYSVGEGESFDDDTARVQLIAKTPYPDLGDKLTRLRSEDSSLGKKVYAAMTLAKVAQIAGRVMRHEKDFGETIILDGTFRRLWAWHKGLAPSWFHDILNV